MAMSEHIIIIGGGGTGAALAHDLVLRGFQVTLLEQGEFCSGATGRHHGLLHSGARYVVDDPEAAHECYRENQLLRRIAPFALEQNDGLFVALDDEDLAYGPRLLEGCEQAGIPWRPLTGSQARELEPKLADSVREAYQVPDATVDALRLPLSFLATARAGGAVLRRFCPVTALLERSRTICGVRLRDLRRGRDEELQGDLVINAAGAWAGDLVRLAGVELPLRPGPGVMVALQGRHCDMVLNRLRPAGEGDIVVPQRRLTIVGTSLWLANHPDEVEVPAEHIARMVELGARLLPGLAQAKVRSSWAASRPLFSPGTLPDNPQLLPRTFRCFDHGELHQRPGLLSVIGGKATTLRAMAEGTADVACRLLGREDRQCQTAHQPLLPPRAWYRQAAATTPTREEAGNHA
jgi:glycerol-3-phosphate dehydrogenase